MPARKHRPDKFGMRGALHVSAEQRQDISDARDLIAKLLREEQKKPHGLHWVSWLDMDEARRLERGGLLVEGSATGCFYLTDKARVAWGDL